MELYADDGIGGGSGGGGLQLVKTRIQIDLSPNELERMNTVMRMTDLKTRKELFNNALSLFEWAVVAVASGKQIGSIDGLKAVMELTMPALQNAARYGVRPDAEHVVKSVEASLTSDAEPRRHDGP